MNGLDQGGSLVPRALPAGRWRPIQRADHFGGEPADAGAIGQTTPSRCLLYG